MIYLDYAAHTPASESVLASFCEANREYIANPNSVHYLGRVAYERMQQASNEIARLLNVKPEEIIYTSGASEANNLAVKGIARSSRELGKHIISIGLEHSAVSACLTYLNNLGYEIDLVDITTEGRVDLDHLKELIREDTILVSVGYVDSELGVVQPIREIANLVKKYPNCVFHTDATQAVGKIDVDFTDVDLISFAPHKFFGLNGCGILIKKEGVVMEPQIHGGNSTSLYRSGTPVLPMAVATETALRDAYVSMQERYDYVSELKEELLSFFKEIKEVRMNSTKYSIPYVVNVSVPGRKSLELQMEMEKRGFCISTKSACSVPNTPSRAVFAVSRDRKTALSSIRISLSHLTTKEELEQFKKAFLHMIQQ